MSEYIIPKESNDKALKALSSVLNLSSVRIINAVNPYINGSITSPQKDSAIGVSSLGTPIYTDLTIMGLNYTDGMTGEVISLPNDRFRSGTVAGTAQKGGYYMNFESVLITIAQPIRIVKTEIQGRPGTVKEYIGADDTQISINLIITGKNGVYPREEVSRLKKWLDAPVSKSIVAWWLDNLGVSEIVIENYSVPQVQGGYSYQIFNINAISDTPVELKITQPIK